MAGQQQEEIETIRSRTIEVKLSDADVKRISEKAAAHGLTVGELIENFIGDLVCGTYSNGSSNYNADILGVGKGQGTSSSTEEKRIIKPEEFAYLKDVVCVFPNGYKRLQKANYYEDKTFTDRM